MGFFEFEIGVDVPLAVELDRSSPVPPLYYQLAQAIEAAIRSGELAPGDRFEKRTRFGQTPDSVPTHHEACDPGARRQGSAGAQAWCRHAGRPESGAPQGRTDQLVRRPVPRGQEPTTQLLEYRVGPPDEDVARELSLAEGREVACIKRLRCANGEPLALMTNYLPVEIAPPDAEELERSGLYQSLRGRGGVHIRLASQRIGAKAASRSEAKLLDEKPGAPLLTMDRTAFDDSGRAVEFGTHCYRAARYYFDTTLVDR